MGRKTIAYAGPFVIFVLLLGAAQSLDQAHIQPGKVPAMYWTFPLQTVVCGAMLAWFWREYRLTAPRKPWLAAAAGVLMFALWVSPQVVLHRPARVEGFDPQIFAGQPGLYWGEVVMRFLRLVVVVPALEEIFWRGFLLRFVIDEDFEKVPFGSYGRMSNAVVAVGFMLEHTMADWPAALVTGLAYNIVAFRTRSLSSCILAHAITNALLGGFVMATRQWGFW